MTADPLATARLQYARGQDAFERGEYRQAVGYFEAAVQLAQATTPLGGEIQTWLVNAYSAVGRQREAEALCEVLSRHPDLEVRKQGKNLLYILQAPRLQRPASWMTQIPDLGAIDAKESNFSGGSRYAPRPSQPRSAPPASEPAPLDPSLINQRDNGFLWLALITLGLVLAWLAWFS